MDLVDRVDRVIAVLQASELAFGGVPLQGLAADAGDLHGVIDVVALDRRTCATIYDLDCLNHATNTTPVSAIVASMRL